jgi:predicted nucleic acid-binding Zn ribbon protein
MLNVGASNMTLYFYYWKEAQNKLTFCKQFEDEALLKHRHMGGTMPSRTAMEQ